MARMVRFAFSRLCFISTVLLSTVGCDQITKVVVRDTLRSPLSYLGGSIVIEHAQNPGAFLNLGAELAPNLRFWIFSVTVGLGLVLGAVALWRNSRLSAGKTAALTLILAGGIGNLIDRVLYGSVTDFMNFGLGPVRTGIFNVADVSITFGVCLLFWSLRREKRPVSDR